MAEQQEWANMMKALGRMMRLAARKAAPEAEANDVIDIAPLLQAWEPGVYALGDVVTWEGEAVWCVTAHDSTVTTDWTPGAAPSLWAHYHGRDAAHARPFLAEGHNPYNTGHWCTEDGKAWLCLRDGVVHPPSVLPEAWEPL